MAVATVGVTAGRPGMKIVVATRAEITYSLGLASIGERSKGLGVVLVLIMAGRARVLLPVRVFNAGNSGVVMRRDIHEFFAGLVEESITATCFIHIFIAIGKGYHCILGMMSRVVATYAPIADNGIK
jgi:hypothetical protein